MPGVSETRTWDAVLTTTLANYREKLIDQIFDYYPFLSYLVGKLGNSLRMAGPHTGQGQSRGMERLRKLDGGESIVEHLLYEVSSAVKSYSNYEGLDTTPQDGLTIARFSWRQYAATISISGLEKRNNNGETQMLDLMKAKTTQAEMSLRRRMAIDAWGSNADGKSFDGLGTILSTTATLGGLSPTTFTWWQPTIRASGSFAAQGINDMRITFNTISFGEDVPDAIFMPQAVFEFFENTLQPQERYTNTKAANVGFQNLTFKGIPTIYDRQATAGTVTFINSEYINLCVHKDAFFSTGKFIEPENQDASTAKILFQGNMTINNRRMHGRMTGVTA